MLLFLFLLFFLWGCWHSGIAHNTKNLKILGSNPNNGLARDGFSDPILIMRFLQVGHVECVPQAISYRLHFLCISKVSSIYSLQQRRVYSKECCFMFTYTFLTFLLSFFIKKNFKKCFYHFHFFFWWTLEFLQQNINQSKARIGDTKLSVKLYV